MPANRTLRFLSPAKLNLHLEVFGKRDDGFHELETLMTTVSIYDTMSFGLCRPESQQSTDANSIELSCRRAFGLNRYDERFVGDLPAPENNLVYRTALLMRDEVVVDDQASDESRELAVAPLRIELVKRIPSAAGLGGASSNSATTILALNELWKLNWAQSRMAQVAAKLGSDIPFFIYGKSAICRGRGELVTPVRFQSLSHAVVIRPPESLSTAEVFRRLKPAAKEHQRGSDSDADLVATVERGKLFNRLQQSAEELCDSIALLKREFDSMGVRQHQLTGSGSCYFGMFLSRRNAISVANGLRQRDVGLVYVCQSV